MAIKKKTKKAKPAAKAKKPAKKPAAKAAKPAAPVDKLARKAAAKAAAAATPKPDPFGPPTDPEHQVPGGVFLGRVEDYFSHVGVVALTLLAPLSVGDMIRIKGHTTDITQKVESMQINHQPVQTASTRDAIGIRIADRTRKGDAVYKI